MDLKELYQEIILDHGKNPRNKKKCNDHNRDAVGHNPLCGDKVHVFLKLDENKVLQDITFLGEGCAISMASASIMTEILKGKDFNVAKKILEQFLIMIKEGGKININSLNEDQNTSIMSLSEGKKVSHESEMCYLSMAYLYFAAEGKKKLQILKNNKICKLKDKIIEEIKKIYDPEIPVNIYDLGLIYKIDVKDDKNITIDMTLTSP